MTGLLTIPEAAKAVRRSKRTVLNWIQAGLVDTVMLPSGNRLVVPETLFVVESERGQQRTAPARASYRSQVIARREQAHLAVLDAANAAWEQR